MCFLAFSPSKSADEQWEKWREVAVCPVYRAEPREQDSLQSDTLEDGMNTFLDSLLVLLD